MSIAPPALVVSETAPGLVFLKEKNSAVVISRMPSYSPVISVRESRPIVMAVNSGSTGPQGKIGPEGPKGEKGEQGEKGSGGDLHFKFTQGSASEKWEIEHNLGKYPSVSAEDTAGEGIEGMIEYININKLNVIYSSATGGYAYLN